MSLTISFTRFSVYYFSSCSAALGDAVVKECLLVDHLIALLHLRQAFELRDNPLEPHGGGPEVRLGIEGAKDHSSFTFFLKN
ncbi:hypothetical protein SDJN03_19681, partial [Cucurbita argyrosperma subsp. sororia]